MPPPTLNYEEPLMALGAFWIAIWTEPTSHSEVVSQCTFCAWCFLTRDLRDLREDLDRS